MSNILSIIGMFALYTATGVWVSCAVSEYKKEHYFSFGAHMAMAINMILLMIKFVWER